MMRRDGLLARVLLHGIVGPGRFLLALSLHFLNCWRKHKILTMVVLAGLVLIAVLLLPSAGPPQPAAAILAERPAIKLGAVLSLTGRNSALGRAMRRGYAIAVAAINRETPVVVDGQAHDLQLVIYDDESRPARAAEVTTSLLGDKDVVLFLAPYSSALAAPALARARAAGVPSLVAVGSSVAIREQQGGEVFFLQTPARKHLADAVDLILSGAARLGKASPKLKVVLVAAVDDHSQEVINGARTKLEAAGVTGIVDLDPQLPVAQLAAQIAELGDLGAVLVAAFPAGAKRITEALAGLKSRPSLVAMTHCDLAFETQDQKRAAEGFLCALHWQQEVKFTGQDPLQGRSFATLYRKAWHESPRHQAAAAAAAIQAAAAALRLKARSSEAKSLSTSLAALDLPTFYGHIRFGLDGNNEGKAMIISQVQKQRYVPVAPPAAAVGSLLLGSGQP